MTFFSTRHRHHLDLPSFPTRRSSDLRQAAPRWTHARRQPDLGEAATHGLVRRRWSVRGSHCAEGRSEEHTSELQSVEISYAVFCLKKKKKKIYIKWRLGDDG